jgi:transposase-like protein
MSKRRNFKPEHKARIVIQAISGQKSAAQLCREHQISESLLSRWKQQFLEQAPQIFENPAESGAEAERIAELERLLGRLTMELEIAKKASQYFTSPMSKSGR